MKLKNFIAIPLFLFSVAIFAQQPPPLEGRWDITVKQDGKELPSWLEVRHSGNHGLMGRFVSVSGSARAISKVNFADNKFSFSIPPQWESGDGDLRLEGTLAGDAMNGSITYPDGKTASWVGVRAPSLQRSKKPEWAAPIKLFNGKDLKGWHTEGENQWIVEAGVLKSPKSGSNLFSDQSFTDFKMHVEFRYPKGSNSGIYLRGRYEVQVADGKGLEPWDDQFSGIYGFLAPNQMEAKDAGEWQTFDITLIGRRVTVVANGVTVISDQVIPGITGGAMDSKEGEPGPFMIQGDHGPIEYRNIVVTPVK
jgi:Domain of Unknown Function (DUF1080)